MDQPCDHLKQIHDVKHPKKRQCDECVPIGARWVLLFGAAWALFLAWWCDLVKLDHLHGLQDGDPALQPDHATSLDEEGISAGD